MLALKTASFSTTSITRRFRSMMLNDQSSSVPSALR
jgi:hypothetical protein